jgi:hypothetical protein
MARTRVRGVCGQVAPSSGNTVEHAAPERVQCAPRAYERVRRTIEVRSDRDDAAARKLDLGRYLRGRRASVALTRCLD